MNLYAVGKPYNPARTRWPETVQYNYRGGEHELVIFMAAPSSDETHAVKKGRFDLTLYANGPLIILPFCFEGQPWSDAPYSVHLVPEAERTIPALIDDPSQGAALHIVLVDAATGIIRALRLVGLSNDFSNALHRAIQEQAAIPWDSNEYDMMLEATYSRYSSEQLARLSGISYSSRPR